MRGAIIAMSDCRSRTASIIIKATKHQSHFMTKLRTDPNNTDVVCKSDIAKTVMQENLLKAIIIRKRAMPK